MGRRSTCVECVTGAYCVQLGWLCFRPKVSRRSTPRRRARSDSKNANDTAADDFERFHDSCLVRPPEISQRSPLESDSCELGHRILRVLLPGASKSHWLV